MKKKSLGKFIKNVAMLGFLFAIFLSTDALGALNPNYATSNERLQYYYDGYIQIQPSYNDGGYHAAKGSFTYANGSEGTKTWSTDWGKGFSDSKIYSKSGTYHDTLNPFAPKVTFNYRFHKVKNGGVWPA